MLNVIGTKKSLPVPGKLCALQLGVQTFHLNTAEVFQVTQERILHVLTMPAMLVTVSRIQITYTLN